MWCIAVFHPSPSRLGIARSASFSSCRIGHRQFGGSDRLAPPLRRGMGATTRSARRRLGFRVDVGPTASGSASSRSATVQSSAAQILSRSSSRTVIGVPLHSAATLLSDGCEADLAGTRSSRSVGRQMSRLAAAHRRFHFTAGSPCPCTSRCAARRAGGQVRVLRVGVGGRQVGNVVVAQSCPSTLHLPQRHSALVVVGRAGVPQQVREQLGDRPSGSGGRRS